MGGEREGGGHVPLILWRRRFERQTKRIGFIACIVKGACSVSNIL